MVLPPVRAPPVCKISPSKDTLDVRLVISSLNNKTDGWKILTNGKSTIVGTGLSYGFPVSSDVFKLTIDSRWYYTKATTVSGK